MAASDGDQFCADQTEGVIINEEVAMVEVASLSEAVAIAQASYDYDDFPLVENSV